MKESRESLVEMQKSHEQAAADQAKAAADLKKNFLRWWQ